MGAIGQSFAFVLLLVLPVLQGTDTTKKVRNADIDCEDNQIMVPLKEPHDGITSARFKCVNVTDTENENESSINCGCVWLDKCPSLFKKHTNNTVYVAGIDVQPTVVLYKCCWSDRFIYDLELCNEMKKGDQMPALINDGENTTIVNHIRNSQTEYTICNATANDQSYCLAPDWSRGVTSDASWVVGLVLGLAFIPASCVPIDTTAFTVDYDPPADVILDDTVATLTCPDGSQLPYGITEYTATCTKGAWVYDTATEPICCRAQYEACPDAIPCCNNSPVNPDSVNDGMCIAATDNVDRCSVGDVADTCTVESECELQTFQTPLLTICANNKCMVCLPEGPLFCYTISSGGAIYPDAITNCAVEGGQLATIPGQSIQTLFYNMALSAGRESAYFGYRTITPGMWEWVDGSTAFSCQCLTHHYTRSGKKFTVRKLEYRSSQKNEKLGRLRPMTFSTMKKKTKLYNQYFGNITHEKKMRTYTNWRTDLGEPNGLADAINCAGMLLLPGWTGEWVDNTPRCSIGPTIYFCQFVKV